MIRVGISISSFYAVDDPREGAQRMVERAAAAERAGLDSLFVGDHHAMPRPYYQNSAILGRLLGEWGDRPAGALYLLPLWHPVLLAEQVGTLASLAKGRFILQCAVGPADRQFEALGVDPKHRPSRFEEGLAILRRLWAGETVSTDGRYSFAGARVSPVPPEPVEVWIGGTADAAVDRAARLGDGWIASPHLAPEAAKERLSFYRQCEVRHGRPAGRAVIRRDIYVGESDPEAEQTTKAIVDAGHRGFPGEALIIGGPAAVARAFEELATMGYEEVLIRNLVTDQAQAVATIERLAAVKALLE